MRSMRLTLSQNSFPAGVAAPIEGNTSSIPTQSFRIVWDALSIRFFSVPLARACLLANRALANTSQIGAASGFERACCEIGIGGARVEGLEGCPPTNRAVHRERGATR